MLKTNPAVFFLQNFDAEVSAVVAETVWDTPERQKYLSETIVEHLYRQGMLSVAEDLCQVLSFSFNYLANSLKC